MGNRDGGRQPRASERAAFAEWLQEQRAMRSVRAVAEAAGQPARWYERIEDGARRSLTTRELRLLAKGLGIEARAVIQKAREVGY